MKTIYGVTLNLDDEKAILAMASDEYRTPEQQIAWIVRNALKGTSVTPPETGATAYGVHVSKEELDKTPKKAAPKSPAAIAAGSMPVYHVGDGSAGSGCGKVGFIATRRLTGTINPGDILHCKDGCFHQSQEGLPLEGKLSCCQCGGDMNPGSWSYADDEGPERPSASKVTMARMEEPK